MFQLLIRQDGIDSWTATTENAVTVVDVARIAGLDVDNSTSKHLLYCIQYPVFLLCTLRLLVPVVLRGTTYSSLFCV
jgi:hypothetical protein